MPVPLCAAALTSGVEEGAGVNECTSTLAITSFAEPRFPRPKGDAELEGAFAPCYA